MRQPSAPPNLADRITLLHEQACRQGKPTYEDPATGYTVMTANFLRSRGTCCGSGCRHCPYREGSNEPRP